MASAVRSCLWASFASARSSAAFADTIGLPTRCRGPDSLMGQTKLPANECDACDG